MPIDIERVKADAVQKYEEDKHKVSVAIELERLRARKAHFFPKRVRFQWPILFEHWYNPDRKR